MVYFPGNIFEKQPSLQVPPEWLLGGEGKWIIKKYYIHEIKKGLGRKAPKYRWMYEIKYDGEKEYLESLEKMLEQLIDGGTATMSSGKIITNDGKNTTGSYGGAVMVKGGGTFKMLGGSIQKNDHGAVYINEKSTFEMSGGSITNNSGGAGKYTTGSLQYGGGIYVDNGTFRMTGGVISGNNCYKSGAGVFVDANGTFCIKKSPYIASTDDVYLVNGRKIKVEDSLSVPSGYTAPLCTINVDNDTVLGSAIVTSSIDALEASSFVDMFALKNANYTLYNGIII